MNKLPTENYHLEKVAGVPLILDVSTEGLTAVNWAEQHQQKINELLNRNGALLLRGLNSLSSRKFGSFLATVFADPLIDYKYRSTPRTELKGKVYTTTEYHADQNIPLHNENSYSNEWAMRVGFMCMLPASSGGETPICDSRLIYQDIPNEIKQEFECKKIKYVRNYSELDLPWEEVFQTSNRADAEQYCYENQIAFEWLGNNQLRTSQIAPASAIHPKTKEKVWFNQAHLFHISNLHLDHQNSLLKTLGKESLPRNAYFADGSEIDVAMLDEIRKVYSQHKIVFQWQSNDILLLDNMLFAHGRNPYEGERKVLAGMARPSSLAA